MRGYYDGTAHGVVVEVNGRLYWPGRGRFGTHVHIINGTSSVTWCGWWHRGHALNTSTVITCEHCLTLRPDIATEIEKVVTEKKAELDRYIAAQRAQR